MAAQVHETVKAEGKAAEQKPGFISRFIRFASQVPTILANAWLWAIPVLAVLSSGYVYIYAQFVPAGYSAWNVVGCGLVFGAAAFLAGGVLGFLFGIPKAATSAASADSEYTANTNLEQISNWLTTIVVGLTLTQIGKIPGAWGKLTNELKVPLGNQSSSGDFGAALVIFYAVLGFLYLYLWSRTLLMKELRKADKSAVPLEDPKAVLSAVEAMMTKLQAAKTAADAKAQSVGVALQAVQQAHAAAQQATAQGSAAQGSAAQGSAAQGAAAEAAPDPGNPAVN
jgi:hypothetical protein